MLVESLAAEFEPQKYPDNYRDNLRKMIQAKIEGNKRGGDAGNAHRAGDRHYGSAEEEPRNAQAAGDCRGERGASEAAAASTRTRKAGSA